MISMPHAPPRVDDVTLYWERPPPEPSPRLVWWLKRIENGWRGNKRTKGMGYDTAAKYYGVYIWEYIHTLAPKLP